MSIVQVTVKSTQCQGYVFCEGQEEPFAERSNKGNEYAPKTTQKKQREKKLRKRRKITRETNMQQPNGRCTPNKRGNKQQKR